MEMRSYFSLLCLHQETQMVFTHLPLVTSILGTFVHSQIQGHKEVHFQRHNNSITSTDYFSSSALFTLCELCIFIPQMGDVWGELHPKLKDLLESANEPSPRSSSQTHTSRGQKTCAVIGPA